MGDPEVPTHAIEIVSARVEQMVLEAKLLQKAVQENSVELGINKADLATSRNRFRITIGLIGLVLLILFGLSALNTATSNTNRDLNAKAAGILSRLNDCLIESEDPDSCYAQQQARTGDLLGVPAGPVNTVTVLGLACAQHERGEEAILDCVERRLAAR